MPTLEERHLGVSGSQNGLVGKSVQYPPSGNLELHFLSKQGFCSFAVLCMINRQVPSNMLQIEECMVKLLSVD